MSPAASPDAKRDIRVVVAGAFAADCVVNTPVLPGWGEDHEVPSIHTTPGGKALNQAVALARLGAQVTTVGAVGDDALGRETLALLTAEGVDTGDIEVRENTATPVCICFVGDDGKASYVSHTPPDIAVTAATIREAEPAIRSADAVLATLEPLPEAVDEVIHLGREAGAHVVVQPAPIKHAHADIADLPWSQTDLVVPNEKEARFLLKDREALPDDPAGLSTAFSERMNGPKVVVTLGKNGCITVNDGTPTYYAAHEPPEVVDTTGASDAFTAALTFELTASATEPAAIQAALTSASMAVTKPGGHSSMPRAVDIQEDRIS